MDIRKIRNLIGKTSVLDNNILNDFTELGCLSLLNEVFEKIYIPVSILEREATIELIKASMDQLEYTPTALEKAESFQFLLKIIEERPALSEYDAECVAIAKEKMVLCTSNENRIMSICREYGIEYTGTIGILCCAYEHQIISREDFVHLMKKLFSPECTAYLGRSVKNAVFSFYNIE